MLSGKNNCCIHSNGPFLYLMFIILLFKKIIYKKSLLTLTTTLLYDLFQHLITLHQIIFADFFHYVFADLRLRNNIGMHYMNICAAGPSHQFPAGFPFKSENGSASTLNYNKVTAVVSYHPCIG